MYNGVAMQKKVLSEISLYQGDISMPKGFAINTNILSVDILKHQINTSIKPTSSFPFSKTWSMLNTYITDHINVKYNLTLINKSTWGNIYKPNEVTTPLLNIDPVDLRNSPDYVLLYGVAVKDCSVRICYDDNRRKGGSWDIPLEYNKFIMFPSTCMYHLTNKQTDSLNFVQTITYDFI